MHRFTLVRASLLCLSCVFFVAPASLHAFDLDSPSVKKDMWEIELKNRYDRDSKPNEDRYKRHSLEVGRGVTQRWALEVDAELENESQHGYRFSTIELESLHQFAEKGEYWADTGIKLGAKHGLGDYTANIASATLLAQKQLGHFIHALNVGFEKEFGAHSEKTTAMEIAAKTEYEHSDTLGIGLEYFGDLGELKKTGNISEQKHRAGPAVYAQLAPGVTLETGWHFGLSEAAENHSVKFNLEYEFSL